MKLFQGFQIYIAAGTRGGRTTSSSVATEDDVVRLTAGSCGDVDLEALEELHVDVAADLTEVVAEHLAEALADGRVARVQRDVLAPPAPDARAFAFA